MACLLSFKKSARQLGLPDDRTQRSDLELIVVRDRNCDCRVTGPLLHDNMAAALPHLLEAVVDQDATHFAAR